MADLILLLAADADVQRAFEYYEEFQEGCGAVFLHCLDAALEQLRRFPAFPQQLPAATRTQFPIRRVLRD